MSEWQNLHDHQAPENVELDTKIDNEAGCRNDQTLMRRGNLWWYPDGSMYVYYTPTHWRLPSKAKQAEETI